MGTQCPSCPFPLTSGRTSESTTSKVKGKTCSQMSCWEVNSSPCAVSSQAPPLPQEECPLLALLYVQLTNGFWGHLE